MIKIVGTFSPAWEETCLITIQKKGQSAQQFAAVTDSVDLGEGDNPGEGIPTCAGGRIWKQGPAEDGEITLEMYPINLTYMGGGIISSINGNGTTITFTTAAVHGLAIGDTVRISNSTNYGTTDTPVNYTVATVTNTTTVTMLSTTSAAEETDGTWVGFQGNTGLFQQWVGNLDSTLITQIEYDTDAVKITSTAHGYAVGDIIEVAGTTNFNGPYVVEEVTSSSIVRATDEEHSADGTENVGSVTRIADASQPLATDTGTTASVYRSRDQFMVAIMWTDDTAVKSAIDITRTSDKVALRFYAKGCRMISHKTVFNPTDPLKVTVTFKYNTFNKPGTTKNSAWESTNDGNGSNNLPALTYT